jgi:hypothetical protein
VLIFSYCRNINVLVTNISTAVLILFEHTTDSWGYLYAKVTTINNTGEFISKHVGQFTTAGQVNLGFWLNKRP